MDARFLAACIGLASSLIGNAATAAPQTLGFAFAPLQCTSYSNFPGPPTTTDCGLTTLTGTFTFDDSNVDGHVVLSELLNLTAGSIVAPGPDVLGTPTRVTAFDYSPSSGLSFAAETYRFRVTTGVAYRYDAPFGSRVEAWLPSTTATVFAVPEPGTMWLLLAGGALVGARWKRRQVTTV